MKKTITLFLILFAVFFAFGCNGDETEKKEPVLNIEETEISMLVGESYVFDVDVDIIMESSDYAIVNVNELEKKMEAKAVGEATVTIYYFYDESISKTVNVTVTKAQGGSAEAIVTWLEEEFVKEGYNKAVLPTTHPDFGGVITWDTDSDLIDLNNGTLEMGDNDQTIVLKYTVSLNGEKQTGEIEYIIIGFNMLDMRDKFINQAPTFKVTKDISFTTSFSDLGGTYVTWKSSNEEILSNTGKFTQPYNDSEFTITYTVVTTNPATSHTYTKSFQVDGLPITVKAEPIIEWIEANIGENGYLTEYSVLPTELEEFGATLKWETDKGDPFKVADYISNPITSGAIFVNITITIDNQSLVHSILYKVKSTNLTDMWDKVEFFINQIATNSYNSALKVNSPHYFNGYIPFFTQGRMAIVDDIMAVDGKNRPGTIKTSTQYIVVHDTANTNSGAGARSQVNYLKNGSGGRTASWHYTIDWEQCIQTIPDNEVAWHAGDGSRQWGSTYFNDSYNHWSITGGNMNGIGIESCVNIDGNYALTERNLAKLVAGLLIDHNLGFDRIKQHNDFAGKNCPALLRGFGLWSRFIYLVQLEYYGLTELKDVTFTWEPVTNNIDSKGLIQAGLKTGTVTFKVTATYKGTSNSYTKTITF